MAKIQVTESELRELVKESVQSVLNEARWNNYGMNWDQLSDAEKQAYAKRYGDAAGANTSTGGGYYNPNNVVTDYEKLGQYYAQQQKKKGKKANRNGYSAEFFNKTQGELDQYKNALQQIQNALTGPLKESVNEQTAPAAQYTGAAGGTGGVRGGETTQQQAPEQATETDVLANIPQMVQQIQNMRMKAQLVPGLQNKVKQLTTANQQLTAQNQQLTTQNQQLTARVQTNNANQMTPGTAQA